MTYIIKYLLLTLLIVFTGCTNTNNNTNVPIKKTKTKKVKVIIQKEKPSIIHSVIEEKELIEKEIKIPTIAIVFASKSVGKYAISATNSAISYMLYKEDSFDIKVYNIILENENNVQNVFNKLKQDGISKIILMLTSNGVNYLKNISNIEEYSIYLPLINKNDINLGIPNIVYGAIDYKKQLDTLLQSRYGFVSNFYDKSSIGKNLTNKLNNTNANIIYSKEINDISGDYHWIIKNKARTLNKSNVVINMPIVKSSIILSQMNANEVKPLSILSTQLNYSPLLLQLTQVNDRDHLIIANSIGKTDPIVEEYNKLLDNDIIYNWVNYSVSIGMQYLLDNDISTFDDISIINNQVQYPVRLLTTTKNSFKYFN